MARKVYEIQRRKGRAALFQLSDEEYDNVIEEWQKASEDLDIKVVARIADPGTSFVIVLEYPDIETFYKAHDIAAPTGLNLQRYWDVESTFGYEPAGPATRGKV